MVLENKIHVPFSNSKLPLTRADTLPEAMFGKGHFADTGCDLAPSCLNCPFEMCRYDEDYYATERKRQNVQIQEMRNAGFNVTYIANHFDMGVRTVYTRLLYGVAK